jgi:hypothetical protein
VENVSVKFGVFGGASASTNRDASERIPAFDAFVEHLFAAIRASQDSRRMFAAEASRHFHRDARDHARDAGPSGGNPIDALALQQARIG